jgi:lipopolysaccharide export system protein LptA
MRLFATLVVGSSCMLAAFGQQPAPPSGGPAGRVEILHADRWDFDERLAPGAQRLIGAVRFKHGDALMQCDSAYLFENNTLQAFSRIQIRQGDTLTIAGDRLDYDGNERLATISGHVRLNDPAMEMTTDALTYQTGTRVARYSSGAVITGKREPNTLTSRAGAYSAAQHRFVFSEDVRLENPERTVEGDTLHYVTTTGIAEFFGPTRITQGRTVMWCERGTYDTRSGNGRFTKGGRVIDQGQELQGDTLDYDGATGIGVAHGHVAVIDTANDMTVRGGVGRHEVRSGKAFVTRDAELVMDMSGDTLFLHADTLFASKDSNEARVVIARRGVRFYKSDMQGVCDTMVYTGQDSLIQLIGGPFLWSRTDQIKGDSVSITLRDGRPHRLRAVGDALLVSEADTAHFDQVAGTRMTGHFREDKLAKLEVEGNCRTIYFAREEQPDSTLKIIGVNRADCSRLNVDLDTAGQVVGLTFITKPDAVLYPLSKAPADALRLKGFVWNAASRPVDRADIFRRERPLTVVQGRP